MIPGQQADAGIVLSRPGFVAAFPKGSISPGSLGQPPPVTEMWQMVCFGQPDHVPTTAMKKQVARDCQLQQNVKAHNKWIC